MAEDHPSDQQEAFEREVRAAWRRRAGGRVDGDDGLRVAIDGTSPIDAHRQRMVAILLALVVALIATVVSQVL